MAYDVNNIMQLLIKYRSQTTLTLCKEELVSEDQTNKWERIWFLLDSLFCTHSNTWRPEPISETYCQSDGRCTQSETESITTISEKEG